MIFGGSRTRIPRRSPAARMIDIARENVPAPPPADLEARIVALEKAAPSVAFDTVSWFWMLLLGIVLPLALLIAGWRA